MSSQSSLRNEEKSFARMLKPSVILFGAVILFAVVAKDTVASPTGCEIITVNSHVNSLIRRIDEKNKTVADAIVKKLLLENEIEILMVTLDVNASHVTQNTAHEIVKIFENAKTTYNEAECMKYYNKLEENEDTPRKNVQDRIMYGMRGMVGRLIGVYQAADGALKDLHNLKLRARSCRGYSCCSIRNDADAILRTFLSKFNGLSCADKTPKDFALRTIQNEFEAFEKLAREVVRNTTACVRHGQE
ncbi:uncharacterized protein [Venturia canescens]|uniref:uncharacterized protein n=1 Tax=Venturia canescens TaxID=32260 RepID=UPI001C9C3EA4|nr:uncharacterized protein LOC122416065 [Venturia canescens]XP_043284674.1 uncharacterized protein LOC122416065 [Venturia canescens]